MVLGERLKLIDIAVLIISFTGIIILLSGIEEEEDKDKDPNLTIGWYSTAFMFFAIPTFAAINAVNLRKMRKLNDFTIATYLSIVMFFVFIPYTYIFESGMSELMPKFNFVDWQIFFLLGFTSILMQVLRKKAMTYEEPGKIGSINFLTSVIQLIIDLILFNTAFVIQQVIGIIMILGINFVKFWTLFLTLRKNIKEVKQQV